MSGYLSFSVSLQGRLWCTVSD